MPPVAEPTGRVRIDFDKSMVPIDADIAVTVTVLNDANETDITAQGPINVTVANATVTEPLIAVDGVARGTVRFHDVGTAAATAEYGPQSGTAEAYAYHSQIEIWELDVDEDGMAAMLADPWEKIWVPSTMTVDGTAYEGKVRLRGGTSRDFDKKSFRFNVKGGATSWGQKRLNLRAEYADKTMARSWLAADFFKSATWLPTPNATPVHLRINGEYYGFMMQLEQIDSFFLVNNGLSPGGNLYEGDPPSNGIANLTPMASLDDYANSYDTLGDDFAPLQAFVEELLHQPQTVFDSRARSEIDIDSVLVYMAAMTLIQNQDHILKNYSLYSDYDMPWMVIPWDMDLTFGHLYSDENDVFEETIVHDGTLLAGVDIGTASPFNKLHDVIMRNPNYASRYYAMLEMLMENYFQRDNVADRLETFHCLTGPDIFLDPNKRASNDEYLRLLDEIPAFVDTRQQFVGTQLNR